jgi:hypothetical protein
MLSIKAFYEKISKEPEKWIFRILLFLFILSIGGIFLLKFCWTLAINSFECETY